MRSSIITILQNIVDVKRNMMQLNASAFIEQVSIINNIKSNY